MANSSFRVELIKSGVKEFLRTDCKEIVEERANQIRSELGDGYGVSVKVGKNRANASVIVETWDAYKEEEENHNIEHALKGH